MLKPLGLYGKPARSCFPGDGARVVCHSHQMTGVSISLMPSLQDTTAPCSSVISYPHYSCLTLSGLATDLAGVSSGQIQHVEEQTQLAAQAELLLAQVVLDQAADRLQKIQHLAEAETSGWSRGCDGLGRAGHHPPGSCSCSRHWGYGAPGLQTESCYNA